MVVLCPGWEPVFFVLGDRIFPALIFGSGLSLLGGWFYTRGAASRWKIRLAVIVFICFPLGWSAAALMAEDAAWRVLLQQEKSVLERLRDLDYYADRPQLRKQLEEIQRHLTLRPKSPE